MQHKSFILENDYISEHIILFLSLHDSFQLHDMKCGIKSNLFPSTWHLWVVTKVNMWHDMNRLCHMKAIEAKSNVNLYTLNQNKKKNIANAPKPAFICVKVQHDSFQLHDYMSQCWTKHKIIIAICHDKSKSIFSGSVDPECFTDKFVKIENAYIHTHIAHFMLMSYLRS